MKPDSENRLVDYLYDDLSDAERDVFMGRLAEDPEAADEARAYSAVLSLVREGAEEISPSPAATEQLVHAAHRATRPWWVRFFGESVPGLLLRPAVGAVTVAVLLLGLGVFFFLSGRSEQGAGSRSADRAHRSTHHSWAARPAGSGPASSTVVASGEARQKDPRSADLEATANEASPAPDESDALDGLAAKDPGLSEKKLDTRRSRLGSEGFVSRGVGGKREARRPRGGKSVRRRKELAPLSDESGKPRIGKGGGGSTGNRYFRARRKRRKTKTAEKRRPLGKAPEASKDKAALARTGATRTPAAAPKPVPGRAPTQGSLAGGVHSQAGNAGPAPQAPSRRRPRPRRRPTSAPAMYNAAQTHLAKGHVAQACQLFSSLVRHHQNYPRRADALLGWARCEMARGAYHRAERIVRKLMREHKNWQKSGQAWLSEIRRQRRRAAQRASQRARARRQRKGRSRRAAPRRAAPRPAETSN